MIQESHSKNMGGFLLFFTVYVISGCATPPDLTGYPANTPFYYPENRVFYEARLDQADQHTTQLIPLQHIFEVDPNDPARRKDMIENGDPLSVVLQGVRIPESLPGGRHDIAVVLDICTSGQRGLTTLLAFYQRDVPSGQLLNFNNLLVYADPMWDSSNPPYFRVRVLDVRAERNRRTNAIFEKVSNLSAQIGGMVPHPAIPLVTTAMDAARLLLSNQQNKLLLDYQIQFYSTEQIANAGGATLGPLLAGSWLAVGRIRNGDASFWNTILQYERTTCRLITNIDENPTNVPVPYVQMALLKADAQVPKLVLDRSESLLSLLSTPAGKSDLDSLENASEFLAHAIDAFSLERSLRKYGTIQDVAQIIKKLEKSEELSTYGTRRLMYVMSAISDPSISKDKREPNDWVKWWANPENAENVDIQKDPTRPFGLILKMKEGD
jgi:hypothetical protein